MTVVKIWCGGAIYNNVKDAAASLKESLKQALCDASVINTLFKTYLNRSNSQDSKPIYCGNDTECALLALSDELGKSYEGIREKFPDEDPCRRCFTFSSDRKRMSTVVNVNGVLTAYVKGAAEIVLDLCGGGYMDASSVDPLPMKPDVLARIHTIISEFSDEGLRTIGIAKKVLPKGTDVGSLTVDSVSFLFAEGGLKRHLNLTAVPAAPPGGARSRARWACGHRGPSAR
jgi:magnesium-transporting ATPase (P-type)